MTATDVFEQRSAGRRLVALLGTLALGLGVLAATPTASASASAPGDGRGTDESRATAKDVASGAVRTTPDPEPRGVEIQPSETQVGQRAAPSNDNFPGATITLADGTVLGNNIDSTGEAGEPNIAGSTPDRTVWYSWTAPENGLTSFNTRDATFDSTLNVFTGAALAGLVSVAANNDFNGVPQSKATFTAVAGTTYRVAVDGFTAAEGTFTLQWAQNSPTNDDFASATVLTGATGKTSTNTARSTGEPGEPNHGSVPDRSVWYSWTAPETGSAVVHTRESNFDTVLAVYTGTTIAGLTQLASSDQFNGVNQSKVTLAVTAGTTYRIAVDGFGNATGSLGLQWSINPPANDNFDSPKVLPDMSGTTPATTVRATGEPGELDFHGGAAADNSSWFTWTPTVSRPTVVRLTHVSAGFSPGIGVYTGTSLGALTSVGSGATAVSFAAVAGTSYRIAVDGNANTTGTFDLEWSGPGPEAPTVTGSTPSVGAVSVAFTPGGDGGSPITGYTAECVSTDGGVTKTAARTASPISVSGLTAAKRYHCRVRATNALGEGPPSGFGTTVLVPAVAPGQPVVTSAKAVTKKKAKISFSLASDGGSPVTSYEVSCTSKNGGKTRSATGPASPIKVKKLTPGKKYKCQVRATNVAGVGPWSQGKKVKKGKSRAAVTAARD